MNNAVDEWAWLRTTDELMQQVLQRLLVGNIQEQMSGEIRIEPTITI